MAPRLQLIHSKVQRAAAIADGTAQGIEGHVADPPKVLSSENDLDMSVDDDVDEDLAIRGSGITLDDDDQMGEDVDDIVKAPIPPGSRKYVSYYFNQFS